MRTAWAGFPLENVRPAPPTSSAQIGPLKGLTLCPTARPAAVFPLRSSGLSHSFSCDLQRPASLGLPSPLAVTHGNNSFTRRMSQVATAHTETSCPTAKIASVVIGRPTSTPLPAGTSGTLTGPPIDHTALQSSVYVGNDTMNRRRYRLALDNCNRKLRSVPCKLPLPRRVVRGDHLDNLCITSAAGKIWHL